MNILKLGDNEFQDFFKLIVKMIEEADFKAATPNKEKIYKLFKSPNVVVFGAYENQQIIGFISALSHEYFFSDRKRISDLGLYVLPKLRGSRASIKLIKQLEKWAEDMDVNDIHIGQTTAVNMEKTRQFYERLGYKTIGFNTVKYLKE